MGTDVLSLDVEEIRVSHFDYLRITSGKYVGKEIELSRQLNEYTKDESDFFEGKTDRWRNLPVKIMMGDGVRWMGLISFEVKYRGNRKWIKVGKMQKDVKNLIRTLPVVTGVGIKGDVDIIEELFTDMNGGKEVKM